MEDEGIYICKVINFVGSDICLGMLFVIGEGKRSEFIKFLENVEVLDGSIVRFEVYV